MKAGATLINTCRGAVVTPSRSLTLSNGGLTAAGLDVFKEEQLPVDSH